MTDHLAQGLAPFLAGFRLGGEVRHVEPLGSGHIHDTYLSRVALPGGIARFVHQRINRRVFPEPEKLMHNLERIIGHLRGKAAAAGEDPTRACLTLVPTLGGGHLLRDAEGEPWRTFIYIENARTHDTVASPEQAYQVGRAFARFQQRMSDLPAPRLHETIPHFGDTRRRFANLLEMLDSDPHGRAAAVGPEVDFVREHQALASLLVDLLEQRRVPERVIHYDTKINNVMLDERSGEALTVIDLDTVMPGTALYDFGDAIRTGVTRAAEDERDLDRVRLDLALFEAMTRGYLEIAGTFLDRVELEHLVPAARAVAYTAGVRFLADHLAGDTYFKISRPGHNLERCRVQLALARRIEVQAAALQRIVQAAV